MSKIGKFEDDAPKIMQTLMHHLALSEEEAAAIVGNFGHETGGFKSLQEIKPIVQGARGGWGLAQWTGARRVAFEKYALANHLAFDSLEANVAFAIYELTHDEARALPAVKAAQGLYNKVVAFEQNYERAHPKYKHYDSRYKWARKAAEAYRGDSMPVDVGAGTVIGGATAAAGTTAGLPWWVILIVMAAMVFVGVMIARKMRRPDIPPLVILPPDAVDVRPGGGA